MKKQHVTKLQRYANKPDRVGSFLTIPNAFRSRSSGTRLSRLGGTDYSFRDSQVVERKTPRLLEWLVPERKLENFFKFKEGSNFNHRRPGGSALGVNTLKYFED